MQSHDSFKRPRNSPISANQRSMYNSNFDALFKYKNKFNFPSYYFSDNS